MKTLLLIAACIAWGNSAVYAADSPVASRGIDHMGITVPSIKEAAEFFHDTFGCDHVTTIEYPITDSRSQDRKTLVAPRASSMTIAMFRCGVGSNVELFEFANSKGRKSPSNLEDVGIQHIAFYTDNMERAVAYLKSKGLTILAPMPCRTTARVAWTAARTTILPNR
jgi:catechol 2,3-dioxygenase-like lactoylglutathione lyase family enzyme